MSSNHLVNSIFSEFQKSLDDEQELRDVIRQICKEVDQISREITTVLQVVHHNEEGIAPACQQARQLFEKANEGYQRLKKAVPSTDFYKLLMLHINDLLKPGIYGYADNRTVVKRYMPGTWAREQVQTVREAMVQRLGDKLEAVSAWGNDTLVDFNVTKSRRYHDHWRFTTQRYCFLISLTIWLEKGILASHGTVAEILGVSAVEEKEGFHLDIEDYLVGLLHLCSELSRFAVNSVTRGDYEKPLQISKFVMELNAGFRLLNLKNDHLRKRFDALKYDVKKIEEVVYDLSIRGLLVKPEPTAES